MQKHTSEGYTMERTMIKEKYTTYIINNPPEFCKVQKEDDMHFRIEMQEAIGEINFYDSKDSLITELLISKKTDDDICFYLHFELNDFDRAIELYHEMRVCFKEIIEMRTTEILLCCTSALTTTFFSNKMNDAVKLLGKPYSFSATSYNTLLQKAEKADIILVAPQIAFRLDEISRIYENKITLAVPPKIFASYNVGAMIDLIDQSLAKKNTPIVPGNKDSIPDKPIPKATNTLAIAVYLNNRNVHIKYMVSNSKKIVHVETVRKKSLDAVKDICDIIDTIGTRGFFVDMISISIPGIINEGHVDMPGFISYSLNFEKYLTDRYHTPVILSNDVNAAVAGYAYTMEYSCNIGLLFQPLAPYGGVGISIRDNVITGKHNIAGEIKYLVDRTSDDNIAITPDNILKNVVFTIRTVIAIIDPDLLILCSKYTPDAEIIKERLLEIFPPNYIPQIVLINEDELLDYMLYGTLIMSS